jgi:hypothetical protein
MYWRDSYFYLLFFLFVFVVVYVLLWLINYGKYSRFLMTKFWYVLIWWKFASWKTRLLSQIWKTAFENKKFVISNFYLGYSFLNFSSKKDFLFLVNDLLFLGEIQNYSDEDFLLYYKNYWKDFINEWLKRRKEFRKKYKYIPCNWYVCNFVVLCDEFHQYFSNREHMVNFSWENKEFLTSLHQVRHFNTLMVLATQDIEDLDLKFRKLASYEIDTLQFWNLIFWFNIFRYNHKRNEDEKNFDAINKLPILRFNSYSINFIIKSFEKKLNSIKFLTRLLKRKISFRKFNTLPFDTKFNVNVAVSIYKEWDLFVKLNDFFKKQYKNQDDYLNIEF